MLEIIIQGRGGQGAQTAGNLLARAFFNEGKAVQAFASYGGARRGTPVSSYIRVADQPVRRRCDIEHPDAILCFDATLLDARLLGCVTSDTLIVVNSGKTADQFKDLADCRIYSIDGFKVASENGLGRFINSALLGAFTAVLERPDIESMRQTIAASAPVKREENVHAFVAGYHLMNGSG